MFGPEQFVNITASSAGGAVDLERLHERHYGLTSAVSAAFAEAAGVCIEKHHPRPTTFRVIIDNDEKDSVAVNWPPSSARARLARLNPEDVVKEGAYAVAIAVAELRLALYALQQAQKGTGSDYYLAPAGSVVNADDGELDLENAYRLEVSGSDRADEAGLRHRLSIKARQLRKGTSDLPAFAAVVGFEERLALARSV